jgi:hypothetical protein
LRELAVAAAAAAAVAVVVNVLRVTYFHFKVGIL